MVRTLLAWVTIVLSILFLILSLSGITAIWAYKEAVTREALDRLTEIDNQLGLGEAALGSSRLEIERALSILDSTEAALNQFTHKDPQVFFKDVLMSLDDELLPELETARERLINARDTLENVRVVMFGLNIAPFIQVNIPDKTLTDLIDSADALESKIGDIGDLAELATILLEDASTLFGGNDLAGMREKIEGFLTKVTRYEQKISGWRDQVAEVREVLPIWVDRASLLLTMILLWFSFSQVSLFLHARAILRGEKPWVGWRRMG